MWRGEHVTRMEYRRGMCRGLVAISEGKHQLEDLRVDGRIESRREQDFPRPSRPTLGPNQPPTRRVPDLSAGGKTAEAWR